MIGLIKIARPQFLIVGLTLFILGALWAVLLGAFFSPSRLLFGYLVILPAQLSVHFSNDYFDMASDRPGRGTMISGGGDVLLEHPELREPVRWIALALSLLSIAVGISFMLTYSYPVWIMVFILLGNLAGWYYSAPPVRLSRRGLGELCYTFIAGLLIPSMGYLVMRGNMNLDGMVFSIPLILYGLASILSVEIPDMEDDYLGNKRTWVVRKGREFGFTLVGWLLFAATVYFFVFPIFYERKIPVKFRVLGLLSLLPLRVGIFGMLKRPVDRIIATRIATWTILTLAVFSVFVDCYLLYLIAN